MNGVQQILSEYERLALAWDSERNSKKANRIFDKLHSLALILRESAEGRRGLESLLGHDALEGLVQPRGFHSLDAEMTLREYRAGRMRFDW